MKTLTWTAPEVMTMRDAEKPALAPGWVVLRVGGTAICGSEISGYLGHNDGRASFARTAGASRVSVVDPNPHRLEQAQEWGATGTLSPETVDHLGMRHTMDRVIDAVGFSDTRALSIQALRRGGCAAWIGLHENPSVLEGNAIVRDEIDIRGSFCYTDEEFRRAVDLVNAGQVFPQNRGWLDIRPLEAGNAAFAEQASPSARFAKSY
jgi:threonine dehydrogenase-like Zn-dependent dehydrogenase